MQRTVTTRSLRKGWERGKHDTRGQREREKLWFTLLNRLVPAIPFVLGRWIRASTYVCLTYDYSWKIGGREESRDCLRYLWRWRRASRVPVASSTLSSLHELSSLRVNKTPKKERRTLSNREKVRIDSTRNKLFIIPTHIPTIIYLEIHSSRNGRSGRNSAARHELRVTGNSHDLVPPGYFDIAMKSGGELMLVTHGAGPVLKANGLLRRDKPAGENCAGRNAFAE